MGKNAHTSLFTEHTDLINISTSALSGIFLQNTHSPVCSFQTSIKKQHVRLSFRTAAAQVLIEFQDKFSKSKKKKKKKRGGAFGHQ